MNTKPFDFDLNSSEMVEELKDGYLPKIPLRMVGYSVAGILAYKLGSMWFHSFRPGPKPEMFRDYRHTT
jgi:hypothetical protein